MAIDCHFECSNRHHCLYGCLIAVTLAFVSLASLSGCSFSDEEWANRAALEQTTRQPIINGTATSNWPAVGALVIEAAYTGYGRQSFCSGTLIDPQWVLTAGHCLMPSEEEEFEPEWYMISFFIGQDTAGSGHEYEADSLHVHEDYYVPCSVCAPVHDIGLVHLEEAVPSSVATPISINRSNVTSYTSNPVTWVGYGMTSQYDENSGGAKHYGTGYISTVDAQRYHYGWGTNNTMPWYGDSGGAGLMTISSELRLIGIISAGDETEGMDTRVDAYDGWVDDIMAGGGGTEDCDITGGDCGSDVCFWVDESGTHTSCFPSDNTRVGQSCDSNYENWSNFPCEDGGYCLDLPENYGGYGEVCYQLCLVGNDGPCGSGETCYAVFEGDETTGVCLPEQQECNIAGGDCPSGQACFPTVDGDSYCFPSSDLGLGDSCNPQTYEPLPCGDGLVCVQTSYTNATVGECYQFCGQPSDCPSGETCDFFDDPDDIGICVCTDSDNDGYCEGDDCNDGNGSIHPGADEVCANGVDDDCDGSTDEGCGECIDNDHDGHCQPDDCDDYNNQTYPGATELCGNNVDDDCDGSTDEDCADCVDQDADGYCESDDCDDYNRLTHPNAPEVCGDAIDNDCDGDTDETCGCVDNDGDGYCAEDDCNDERNDINPGADEICDDGVDNNCNFWMDGDDWDYCGYPDENPSDGNGNRDGGSAVGCSAVSDPDGGVPSAPVWLLIGLSLAVLRGRRR